MKKYYKYILIVLLLTSHNLCAQSEWIKIETNNRLVYKATAQGDKIMDFSHARYMGGGVPLPNVNVKMVVEHDLNIVDYTDVIQSAIDTRL